MAEHANCDRQEYRADCDQDGEVPQPFRQRFPCLCSEVSHPCWDPTPPMGYLDSLLDGFLCMGARSTWGRARVDH